MAFYWSNERIEHYWKASLFSGFHKHLAEIIKPLCQKKDHLIDIGCGPGPLSLYLAPCVKHLTAVDVSPQALARLEEQAVAKQIHNVNYVNCPAEALCDTFDVVVMSYFGTPFSLMEHCLTLSRRILIRVIDTDKKSLPAGFGKRRERENEETVRLALDSLGIPYAVSRHELEFGQPLKSHEEARSFLKLYYPGVSDDVIGSYLAQALIPLEHPVYAFYLPRKKKFSVIVCEGQAEDKPVEPKYRFACAEADT
ncbi:MAG TPA: class I SAM-dependent methyltransferase [Clostridiaceae bacterium]|nr:class I SAM-dependent methyltransferase [Clostridiaceae bacterium]